MPTHSTTIRRLTKANSKEPIQMSETCPFCRFSIPDGAVVCGHCGAEKRSVPVENTDTDGSAVLGLIVAVIGGVGGWFVYSTWQAALMGAGGGFVLGMWGNFLMRAGKGLIIGAICAALFYFIFSFFDWPKVGGVIGFVIGFFSGITKPTHEDRWFR
jgi:hypothetical protein